MPWTTIYDPLTWHYPNLVLKVGLLASGVRQAGPSRCFLPGVARNCLLDGGGLLPVTIWVTLADVAIQKFRHKGIERFFSTGNKSGIQAKHAERLRLILGRLNASTSARDMNLPGLDLHQLRGSRKGTWAVTVSGNWRVTFTFVGKDVDRIDYEDYH